MSSDTFADVIFAQIGSAGIITLNRPKAINALTEPMVNAIASQLAVWADDPSVQIVVLTGAGERGLCAGGDIRALYNSGKEGDGEAETFWRHEYALNADIATYPKPYVALMDGLVMGGGIGLSAHARYRVVTERSKLAMPEVGIGFLPDVGGTWLLSHAPGETGTYLGLTGITFTAADAIYARFADVMISSTKLEAFIADLGNADNATGVETILAAFATDAGQSQLAAQHDEINKVFQGDCVETIILNANAQATDWSKGVAQTLFERSPTSLKVTLAALRRAKTLPSLKACLELELRAGLHILKGSDFYEGVRAQIIDKDRNPKWLPATLAEIDQAAVNAHFDPI
jgi:enoyl-CoA hydratase